MTNYGKWQVYGKSIVAALFFLWTIVAPLLTGDNRISGYVEWVIVSTGGLNMLLTYIVPLNKKFEGGKTIINGGLAALAAAQTVLADGFQYADVTIIGGAFLAIVIGWYAPAITNPTSSDPAAFVRVRSGFNA